MTFTRWEPLGQLWSQMNRFQDEMNRVFNRWGETPRGRPGLAGTYPPVNVWEDAEALYAEAELPGLTLEDLEIFVLGGNQLTIKGNRKVPEGNGSLWHRQERAFGSFERTLTLPFPVDANRVEARLEHGVLKVKLAKSEAAKPRKIAVKAE